MYIIELFIKLKDDIKKGKFKKRAPVVKEVPRCEHIFYPIDSTGKILACSKCGLIYKPEEQDKKD